MTEGAQPSIGQHTDSAQADASRSELDARYADLLDQIRGLGSTLVAYSGGVDSTLLAYAAHEALGDRMLAVLACSDVISDAEATEARTIAQALRLPLLEVSAPSIAESDFANNPPDRCYFCKHRLWEHLTQLAHERGLAHVVDGANTDDAGDFRPGSRATAEMGVRSPLAEIGLGKAEIRALSRMKGLPNWDKPSMACLATRFPYGERITSEALVRVADAEAALRALGLSQFRVRAHGLLARIEVAPSEMEHAWNLRGEIDQATRAAGFTWIALDLAGYRSGAMNEGLEPPQGARSR